MKKLYMGFEKIYPVVMIEGSQVVYKDNNILKVTDLLSKNGVVFDSLILIKEKAGEREEIEITTVDNDICALLLSHLGRWNQISYIDRLCCKYTYILKNVCSFRVDTTFNQTDF